MKQTIIIPFYMGLMLLIFSASAQEITYRTAPAVWPDTLGNHRAVIMVDQTSDAVAVKIDWRRRDFNAAEKRLIITNENGVPVQNIYRININRERAEFIFQPNQGAGKYYVYYFPWKGKKSDGGFEGGYLKREKDPSETWLLKNKLKSADLSGIVKGKVLSLESRTAFDSFYPMEVVAKSAEVKRLVSKDPKPFLVFPEDRKNAIRMFDDIPYKWVKSGAKTEFQGIAQKNEYYVFQLGVFASKGDLKQLKVEYLNAPYPVTCFNLEGNDAKGNFFRKNLNVTAGKVQPLWIGLDIPKGAKPGVKTFQVKVSADNKPAQVITLRVNVLDKVLENRGDDELWRYSRLRWLNSKMGINDQNTSEYTALKVSGQEIKAKMATVVLDDYGMPATISIQAKQILQKPISFVVETDRGPLLLKGTKVKFNKLASGLVNWSSTAENEDLKLSCEGSMESDGYLHYSLHVLPKRDLRVKDIHLNIPVHQEAAKYFMGMGLPGELTPEQYDWKWKGPQDAYWIGDYDAGIYCKLLGASYAGPLLNLYKPAPPPSWYNDHVGGFSIHTVDHAVQTQTFTGAKDLQKDSVLKFEFSLLITPFKEINTKKQFENRYYQDYMGNPTPPQAAIDAGIKIINVHHANHFNPYINYPFIRADSIKAFADKWHQKGIKTKIYYTIRELSNQAAEIWALRSLGTEVYADGAGGGYVWLQEHLVKNYDVQWFTPIVGYEACDAAIRTSGDSRWFNYYIEGLNWLMRKTDMDGLYLDDVSYDRSMLKRIRKVMEAVKPGGLIDLHSNTGFSRGPATQYTEFFPYIDKLWFGESFMYEKMSAPNWLVETSGIPFGLMGDMLFHCGNAPRGMVYGMSSRLGWSTDNFLCDPKSLWKVWDEFGIQEAKMIGYWASEKLVTTSDPDVHATVYVKDDKILIAIASWAKKPERVKLTINWEKLGWKPKNNILVVKEIGGYQEARTFKLTDDIPVDPAGGWLLELN